MNQTNARWWKEVCVYQVYPRSYKDSNGDGVGVISSLDYIKSLGVDVIWMSPVYPTPNEDNGYDISDYRGINPEFGTMEDFDLLLSEAHKRDLKIVMDLVVNHTSDQHPWFIEARKSKDNPYRDYYIWRDGKEGKEPNNWQSFFGGTVWEKNDATDDYYLHLFAKGQPDLNWENPRVRDEVKDIVHFWAGKGVDGFRLDVINCISKVEGLPDAPIKNPTDKYHWAGEHFFNGPKFMEYMSQIRKEAFDRYDVFTVGETPSVTPDHGATFTHIDTGVVHMLFQFEFVALDTDPNGSHRFDSIKPQLRDIKGVTTKWQTELGRDGWNSLYLENHDQPRSVSRYGCVETEELRVISAKMLAAWYLFQKGTPYIYQGQELGMTNCHFKDIGECRDIETLNYYREMMDKGETAERAMKGIRVKSRDNARTPMQWNTEANAGFCREGVRPWIDVNKNFREINVEAAVGDENSVFHFYKKILQLRRQHKVVVYGEYELLAGEHAQAYVYTRTAGDEQIVVLANFERENCSVDLSGEKLLGGEGELLIANYNDVDEKRQMTQTFQLRAYEVQVYIVSKKQ
ncbi:oligo-1,4-1,6-alpha-glucosidase [Planoprotostelium fungivorum]|uniref:Oligo-1,4-1,6-alpha-glucosidase n=1 Tax=Planoprotostelium fungivorum TaxID=1890364 RepID=A0A2P6NIW4_9EUKA|nr:oligo-1,4-1,6-alpha-glucosidase [Planoprotostelium fungivorum]